MLLKWNSKEKWTGLRLGQWISLLLCGLSMTACATDRPVQSSIPDEFFVCAVPEQYPETPEEADLVMALMDTYLAWEDCNAALVRVREVTRAP